MGRLDNFISLKPTGELSEHIDSYYFHSCDDPHSKLNFTYYPHIKHAVTIYLDSRVESFEKRTIVKPAKSSFTLLYSTVRDEPHHVEIQGEFKKVGIVFKPYGLSRFVNRSIKEYHHHTISSFNEWPPQLHKIVQKIWMEEDLPSRIALLEEFLKSQQTKSYPSQLNKIIGDIMYSDSIDLIPEIADKYGMNRKALYRLFIRELDCSPKKFIKILRFRRSLESYLQSNQIKLTEAAVSQFYDQSDFIKNVRKITTMTPKTLTRKISDLENTIFWKID